MKTKIVYVLVSDNEDFYLQQAIISLYSLKIHNPEADVTLVVDDITFKNLIEERAEIKLYITEIKNILCPKNYSKKQRSRHLKTSLREIIEGDYLFIDTDTIICDDLSDVDQFDFNIGAVKDKHLALNRHPQKEQVTNWAKKVDWDLAEEVYYNSGVLYVKDTPESYRLYKYWNSIWKESSLKGLDLDQPALGKALSISNIKIQELDGIWNCQISDNGLKYLYDSKIIHYFASMQNLESENEIIYGFRKSKIFKDLILNGNKVKFDLYEKIRNPKGLFEDKVVIFTGRNAHLSETSCFRALKRIYFNHKKIFRMMESFFNLFTKS